ncbi:hypothetical protein COU18_02405 [Candidatus Kaiserbacteria bacterium CG10_big_fil_rev_8_21_14_0_10_51_14]|uniref:HTTM domain-containing protein n=1 Tax=Candidatus Kaiserbacteria bacterium CG10_big_fil_rev_8_21_14_0_10_51_14 TaxID=1974610 RepID=A0A2H0UBL8_9BACT|nr:MAG: hypothetical protein COU18_02405 [Candidatus Kaiserbacteria bacterium CG10_big_fil_rev_8_21_14_0_10_51_14]
MIRARVAWERFWRRYERMFAVDEIERSRTLQLAGGVLLLGWLLEFQNWSRFPDLSVNAVRDGLHLCWPWFQGCGDWYFLTMGSLGYSQQVFYAGLLGLIVLGGVALVYRRFSYAHAIFLTLFTWEVIGIVLSYRMAVNYWYIHILFGAMFLFARGKLAFLRIIAVVFYFFAGIIKLDSSWLSGKYFSALSDGLYLFPDAFIPVATNAVVLMELALVWLLLSSRREYRLSVLAILFVFHVYSAIYVGFTYPTIVLPMVLVLFLSREETPFRPNVIGKSVVGTFIVVAFAASHLVPFLIEGDVRITLEGNKYGNYMFRANYQCESKANFVYSDGRIEERDSTSFFANYRCEPYGHFFYFKQMCISDDTIERIGWTFDTSVDGSPLQRIVDVEDACSLEYKAFSHNEWIRLPGKDEVEVVGIPAKNRYLPSDPTWQNFR